VRLANSDLKSDDRKVFVGMISPSFSEEQVQEHFEGFIVIVIPLSIGGGLPKYSNLHSH
jgi:RNA recognition motif-containing protein